jgi:hypothetical protein
MTEDATEEPIEERQERKSHFEGYPGSLNQAFQFQLPPQQQVQENAVSPKLAFSSIFGPQTQVQGDAGSPSQQTGFGLSQQTQVQGNDGSPTPAFGQGFGTLQQVQENAGSPTAVFGLNSRPNGESDNQGSRGFGRLSPGQTATSFPTGFGSFGRGAAGPGFERTPDSTQGTWSPFTKK